MNDKKICYLYVLDTLADWEIAHLTAELKSRRFLNGPAEVELKMIGADDKLIQTMGGMTIQPEAAFGEVIFKKGDLLVLPGADTWGGTEHRTLLAELPGLMEKGIAVAAVCGATAALAGSEILNDREHTSNSREILEPIPGYEGTPFYRDEPAVTADNLITASGLAPLEFTREVLRMLDVMKEETAEAWYDLFKTNTPDCFFRLMGSLGMA